MTQYEKPRIEDYGDLTALTASTRHGNEFDDNFAEGDIFGFEILSCDPDREVGGVPVPCITI
jgi:hypothetical protein